MAKKDKKDSDEKSGGGKHKDGKDKVTARPEATAQTDGSDSAKNGSPQNASPGNGSVKDGAKSSKPAPEAATGSGSRTVVRAAPRTVGDTVASASIAADTGSSAPVSVGSTTPVEALTGPNGSAPGSSAPVSVDTTTPVAALTEPTGGAAAVTGPSRAVARRAPSTPTSGRDLSPDDVAEALLVPLRVARRVLPERRTPVVLGVAALALVGVVDLPVAIGIGLGWEALRRWGPADSPASRD